jgi:hypothetical protein
MIDSDIQKQKRELRMHIGRMRRRINSRLYGARREGRRLLSWRQYVTRYPGYALLAAFGAGLAASGGYRRGWLLRRLGLQVVRRTVEQAGQHLWQQFKHVWSQSGDCPNFRGHHRAAMVDENGPVPFGPPQPGDKP